MDRKRGFTLIELLVVIAIIALLLSILLPALRTVREQGRRVVCGQNEKNTGLGLFMYADVTASNGPDRDQSDFTQATGGCWSRWQVYDRTNHLKAGSKPTGGNILFVDGHVQWRHFKDMEHRWFWQQFSNPCFWW